MSQFIRACPFCKKYSAKLMINKTQCGYNGLEDVVYRYRAYVRCKACNAHGSLASGRVMYVNDDLPEWAVDPWEINQNAVDAWNADLKNLYYHGGKV